MNQNHNQTSHALPFEHPDLAFLIDLAEATAEPILDVYRRDFSVDFKSGKEPVTEADRRANDLIVQRVHEVYPDDALLTEEGGFEAGRDGRLERVWFVDPIDGTKEFIRKNGEFAVQIGLVVNRRLELGALYRPTNGDLYVGARGKGCFVRRQSDSGAGSWQRLTCPTRNPNVLIVAMSRSHPSSLAQQAGRSIGLSGEFRHGSVGLKLMAMAEGKAHYYLNDSNSTKAWDIAAPELLFVEAGGSVSDLRGQPFLYDPQQPFHHHGLLASVDADTHAKILDIVRQLKP